MGSELLGSRDQLDTTRHRCAHTPLVSRVCLVLGIVVPSALGVISTLYSSSSSRSTSNHHHAQCAAVKPTLNNTNIREAVSSCLDEAPVDGNCPSNAFRPIACWNVSAVQNMRVCDFDLRLTKIHLSVSFWSSQLLGSFSRIQAGYGWCRRPSGCCGYRLGWG